MIKDNQVFFNRMHVLLDAIIIAGSYMLAWWLKFRSGLLDYEIYSLPMETYFSALIVIIPGYLLLYYACNMYEAKRVMGRRAEVANIVKANGIGFLIFILFLYIIKQNDFSRVMLAIFFGLNVVLDALFRLYIRRTLRKIREKGYNLKHIILVGYSRAAEEYIDRIMQNPTWGYHVRGILDNNMERGSEYRGVKVIGEMEDLNMILNNATLDEIAITLSIKEYDSLEKIVSMCEKSGVHTKFIPDYNNVIPTRPYTEDILGLPVINIRRVPLTNTFNRFIKRTMDIVGSLICIVLFSPVMLVTAIAVKSSSPGPLIFCQERVGLHNKPFKMYKFRSMAVQSEEKEKQGWTVQNDPRVTKVGRVIRATSIDELPQLFNVLKGEMSLVGPRPERPQFVEKFKEEIPRYMIKHQVRPGMTGWAQVSGLRGDTSIRKRIEHDLYYIENWTLGFDIKIMFLTVFKGFINKNAY